MTVGLKCKKFLSYSNAFYLKINTKIKIVGCLLFLVSLANGQQKYYFSLEECIDFAMKNNQRISNKYLALKTGKEDIKLSISTALPQVNANINATYNYQIQTTPIPDFISPSVYQVLFQEGVLPTKELAQPQVFPAQFGTKYSGAAILSLNQMVFNPSYLIGLKSLNIYKSVLEKELKQTKIEVAFEVKKAYYGVLVMKERKELIFQNYYRLDSLLENTKALYENGFAEKIDVNRIQILYNNVSVEKKHFDANLDLTVAYLKLQMGMDLAFSLSLSDTIEDVVFESFDRVKITNFNYFDRVEFEILQNNALLSKLDLKMTKSNNIPTLNLQGTIGATSGAITSSQLFDFDDNWFGLGALTLRMDIPIFNGFRNKYETEKRRIQLDKISNSIQLLQNNIDVEIKKATISYNQAIDMMLTQKNNMKLAQEVYMVSKIKYEEGVGSSFEVTDADTEYKKAQNDYYEALYQALLEKVTLQKALGEFPDF